METMNDFLVSARHLLDLWRPQKTLLDTGVPSYLREPGILSGYRLTNQTWFYYAKSIFHMHNETFNIWTHMIGFFVMWVTLAKYALVYNFSDKEPLPIFIFGTFCLYTLGISTFTHTFHSKSSNIHYTLLLFDYIGVSLYGFGSGLLGLYIFSDEKTYVTVESLTFVLLWLFSWFEFAVMSAAKVIFGHDSCQRKYCIVGVFILYGICTSIPICNRYWTCFHDVNCSLTSLNHITGTYLLFICMGFTFGSHLPELLFPGVFDVIGQSHQLFHIVSTLTMLFQIHTAHYEIKNKQYHHGNPDLNFLIWTTCVLVLCQLCSLFYIRRRILKNNSIKND